LHINKPFKIKTATKILDYDELTKVYRDALGKEYKTKRGGILKIKYFIKTKYPYHKAVCTCSICSRDTELFPEGSIVSSLGHLKEGKNPCGCGKIGKLKNYQWIVMLKRILKSKNRELIHINKDFKNPKKTYPKILDKTYNVCVNSTSLYNLVTYPDADWLKFPARYTIDKDYTESINKAMNANIYYKNITFTPLNWFYSNKNNTVSWKWVCSKCKCFGYVKERNAMNGVSLCECDPNKKATTLEHKYKKCLQATKNGKTFIALIGENDNEMGVKWLCNNSHCNISSYNNYVTKDVGCSECLVGNNRKGYYPSRVFEQDSLYILKFSNDKGDYIKIGRSFNVKNRMYALLKHDNGSVVMIHNGIHKDVYEMEQYIITKYAPLCVKPEHLSKNVTEYFSYTCLNDIVSDMSNSSLNLTLI